MGYAGKLISGSDSISLVVDGNLSLISDESGATVQIIIWE